MANCRKCGAPLNDGDRFCQRCGTKVEAEPEIERAPWESSLTAENSAPVTAPVPAKRSSADDSWTGYAHDDSAYAYTAAAYEPAAVKKHGLPKALIIVLCVIACIIALLAAFFAGTAVGSLSAALAADDDSALYDIFGSDLFDSDSAAVAQDTVVEPEAAAIAVVDAYFAAAQQGDTDAILALVLPASLEAEVDSYGADYALAHIDDWTVFYGEAVESYAVSVARTSTDEYPAYDHNNNINYPCADLDISVAVEYAEYGEYVFDFDLAEADGLWYITYIW